MSMPIRQFDFAEDTLSPPASEVSLKSISELVDQAVAAERAMNIAEEAAKIKGETYRKLIMNLIPSAMKQAGMQKFTTTSGFTVSIRKDLTHSLSADRRESAMQWLEAQGQGGVIKRELTLSFAKGQEALALKVAEEISGLHPDLPMNSERGVASMTLKSLLKRLLEQGVDVPKDIFKHEEIEKAIIS